MSSLGRKRSRFGSMSEDEENSNVTDENVCPICLGPFVEAHITPCNHQYCFNCIARHLENSSSCPKCNAFVAAESLIPALNRDTSERSEGITREETVSRVAVTPNNRPVTVNSEPTSMTKIESMRQADVEGRGDNAIASMLQSAETLTSEQIGQLMQKLEEQKRRNAERADNELILRVMETTKVRREREIRQLQEEMKTLNTEVDSLSTMMGMLTARGRTGPNTSEADPVFRAKLHRVEQNAEELEKLWVESVKKTDMKTALDNFSVHVNQFAKYDSLRCVSVISSWRQGRRGDGGSSNSAGGGDQPAPPNIVTSIELDRNAEFVATAGVLKKIKIFDVARLRDTSVHVHFPVREIQTRAKLSSLSWNKYFKSSLICADYEGFVTLLDTETEKIVREYEEHDSKIWSVDFSRQEVHYFASGSNDTKVKIWDERSTSSLLTIENRAQVCSVKFSPNSGDKVVFGCADTSVYCYDLRFPRQYLYTLQDHELAASYVAFMGEDQLVTASIDSTLKLWHIGASEQKLVRTFRGHQNQRHFVGLSVTDQYIACGSEDNAVYTYYKGVSKPCITYPFGTGEIGMRSGMRGRNGEPASTEDAEGHGQGQPNSQIHAHAHSQAATGSSPIFVSAVSWCPADVPTLFAANSQGTVKMLELA